MMFGDVLRELLEERGITQRQLATDLHIAPSTLGNYICNAREPDFELLKRFSSYFHVSIDYLLDNSAHEQTTLSREEQKLLHIFSMLTEEQQAIYIDQGLAFVKHDKKNKKANSDTPSLQSQP